MTLEYWYLWYSSFLEPEKKVYDADGAFLGLSNSVSVADSNAAGGSHGRCNDSKNEQLDGSSSARPSVGSMRRRSTLSWGNVAPDVRQKKLEEVTGSRLADVFFTIYDIDGRELIYISETIQKSMNPDFKSFDFSILEASVTRSSELQIDLWAKPENIHEAEHLVTMKIDLRSLHWVCKTLVRNYPISNRIFTTLLSNQLRLDAPLPPNCILFHLPDGIYTHNCLANSANFSPPLSPSRPFIQRTRGPLQNLFAACYDALSKLKLIADCNDDATYVRYEILLSIERFLEAQNPSSQIFSLTATEKQSLNATHSALSEIKRATTALKKQVDSINFSNLNRRSQMVEGHEFINKIAERQYAELKELDRKKEARETHVQEHRGHVRRVAQTLSVIFPITPIEDRPLCFQICGQYLPNADDLYATGKYAPTEQGIAAGLGYVVNLMEQLANALDFYFPYPINFLGSASTIEDPITISPNPSGASSSTTNPKRVFPLYQTGNKRVDFEYAVYLLNQDLMGLMALECMRVVNPKATLANLKYLIEVLSSGKGEVPQRKKGKNVLEAVSVTKVNVGGEIVKKGPAAADKTQKGGENLIDLLAEQMQSMRLEAVYESKTRDGAEAESSSGTARAKSETLVKSKAKAKGNGKGKEKEKEMEARPYPAPTVEDETGFKMEGPAPAVIPVSNNNQKIDSRTPFSYL